jgi:hypothetical protein
VHSSHLWRVCHRLRRTCLSQQRSCNFDRAPGR